QRPPPTFHLSSSVNLKHPRSLLVLLIFSVLLSNFRRPSLQHAGRYQAKHESTRKRTESTCKCEGRENAEADKRECEGKKVAAKARKTHCEEAKEDDLLVECEGESSEVSELRVRGLRWPKQDMDRRNTIVHALEKRVPKLKVFANHWAAVFLLKECHNNIINYQRDQDGTSNAPDSPSGGHPSTSNASSHDDLHADDSQTDEDTARAHKAAARKSALQRAVERKALKLRAWAEAEAEAADQAQGTTVKRDMPSNDGETEIENLTEEVRKTIEREEIGVPESSQAPLKAVPKHKRAHSDDNKLPAKKKVVLETKKTPTTTEGKRRPIIYMRRGRGGKVMTGRAQSGNARSSRSATEDPEDDEVSNSSGQTGSSDDE
ncbi:hypothetical protein FRC11_010217, partial [Ceratobasidium sp. 423]